MLFDMIDGSRPSSQIAKQEAGTQREQKTKKQ
jgi:hypothetical protein